MITPKKSKDARLFYTEPENEIIRLHYSGYGASVKCQKIIRAQFGIRRSIGSIRSRAIRLGIRAAAFYKDTEDEIIRLNYFGYGCIKKCQRLIREQLGIERTYGSIQSRAKRMGLQTNKTLQAWDEWNDIEDHFLLANGQKRGLKWLHQHLPRSEGKRRRTLEAIARRCKILRTDRRIRDGWYTQAEIAGMFGCNRSTVKKLQDDGVLKAEGRKLNGGVYVWEFTRQSVKNFITRYPSFLNGRRCDMVQVVDIVNTNGIHYKSDVV